MPKEETGTTSNALPLSPLPTPPPSPSPPPLQLGGYEECGGGDGSGVE